MAVELMPAIREALGLMPTDCTYVPRDVTRRITTMMAMQTAAITVGAQAVNTWNVYTAEAAVTPAPTPTGPYTEPTEEMIRKAKIGNLNRSGVNMRKGPSTNYDLVDTGISNGTEVTVYAKDGQWYFLKVNRTGRYGYIYAEYITLEDEEATPTKKPTEEPAIRLSQGDVNGDGLVSAADAAMVLRYDAGLMDLSDPQQDAADMDGDGQVTSMDAKAILKYVAGRLAR